MKRIRCPKCENYLSFDETKYTANQSLVFICEHCNKQFSVRLNKTPADQPEEGGEFGSITVIENVFGYKQLFPLREGDNMIGRRCVGTIVDIPIDTGDMSMDRNHCILQVKRNKANGGITYTLRDAPSLTGTFLFNEILGNKDRMRVEDGAIITIGATTIILHAPKIYEGI
jgi:hypothetical protein